jgi:hypothetical protein
MFILLLGAFFIIACSSIDHKVKHENYHSENELLAFAEANCFFWYFKKKGYDLHDIRAISGGIVEKGLYSPEKYQQVSSLVAAYQPTIATKQEIDIDLLKCFCLRKDTEFVRSIEKIK